jgi:hypothetical protein
VPDGGERDARYTGHSEPYEVTYGIIQRQVEDTRTGTCRGLVHELCQARLVDAGLPTKFNNLVGRLIQDGASYWKVDRVKVMTFGRKVEDSMVWEHWRMLLSRRRSLDEP